MSIPRVFLLGGDGAECACGWKLPPQTTVAMAADLEGASLDVSLRCPTLGCGKTWTFHFGPDMTGVSVRDRTE